MQDNKCLVLIKPDAVKRGLMGEIITRFEKRGFKIKNLSLIQANISEVLEHYQSDSKWLSKIGEKTKEMYQQNNQDLPFAQTDNLSIGIEVKKMIDNYMISGPIVKIILEGQHCTKIVRSMVGETMPFESAPGTIRGDFSIDSPLLAHLEQRSIYNIIHASDSPESAEREIKIWFK